MDCGRCQHQHVCDSRPNRSDDGSHDTVRRVSLDRVESSVAHFHLLDEEADDPIRATDEYEPWCPEGRLPDEHYRGDVYEAKIETDHAEVLSLTFLPEETDERNAERAKAVAEAEENRHSVDETPFLSSPSDEDE